MRYNPAALPISDSSLTLEAELSLPKLGCQSAWLEWSRALFIVYRCCWSLHDYLCWLWGGGCLPETICQTGSKAGSSYPVARSSPDLKGKICERTAVGLQALVDVSFLADPGILRSAPLPVTGQGLSTCQRLSCKLACDPFSFWLKC